MQQLDHYGNFAFVSDADDAERRIQGILEHFGWLLERAGVSQVLLCNGTDHLPIQPELPRLCTELEARFPGSSFAIARYEDYVRGLGPVRADGMLARMMSVGDGHIVAMLHTYPKDKGT